MTDASANSPRAGLVHPAPWLGPKACITNDESEMKRENRNPEIQVVAVMTLYQD